MFKNHQPNKKPKILLVAMANSVHVARWIELLEDTNYDVRLVSSNGSTALHPQIDSLTKPGSSEGTFRLSVPFLSRRISNYMWVADRLFNDWVRGLYILINIISFKPRLVHVLELQNGGYPVIKAFNLLPRKIRPKLFVTNYGSDVYWYQHLPAHRKKLKRLFALADAFSAECNRDVEIAKSIGFDKMVLETAPVTGGIDLRDLAPLDDLLSIDNRRTIAVKGYQGYWGRAIEALEAIELIPGGTLSDYTVEVYSCDDAVAESVRRLRSMGVKVKTFPSGSLTHTQMLALFRRSRAYIGISKSDGISTSMLEAMSQGAIPIQTDTSCASEWITNKEQGFIVPLAGQGDIAGALQKILANDEYVLEAQRVNIDTIRERYDKSRLREVVQSYYKTLMGPDI